MYTENHDQLRETKANNSEESHEHQGENKAESAADSDHQLRGHI